MRPQKAVCAVFLCCQSLCPRDAQSILGTAWIDSSQGEQLSLTQLGAAGAEPRGAEGALMGHVPSSVQHHPHPMLEGPARPEPPRGQWLMCVVPVGAVLAATPTWGCPGGAAVGGGCPELPCGQGSACAGHPARHFPA